MRRRFSPWLIALGLIAPVAVAQPAWPTAKPITIVVPFSAGGSVDVTARLIGEKFSERLKQTVVVENVTGAGGTIGVAKVMQSAPDGYTFVMGADSPIAIARLVNPGGVRYNALKDLIPVGLVNSAPMVVVARPGLPIGNMADLLQMARAQPGKLSYATSGVGTVLHLAMEMVKDQAKIDLLHVPYRGGSQIITDLLGNQVDLAMLVSISAIPYIASQKIKGIASTAAHRLPLLPDVPALAETPELKGFDIVTWTGLFAPAQTPAEIVERMNRELNAVLEDNEVRAKLAAQGATVGNGSAASFAAFVQREEARYSRIVQTANIKQ